MFCTMTIRCKLTDGSDYDDHNDYNNDYNYLLAEKPVLDAHVVLFRVRYENTGL